MLSEDQLIPYQESPLPPGPWLVFSPHPDDEVFGMGGTIARAVEAGTVVEVVVLTAGDQAGDPLIRRKESETAGEVLGISHFHFWGLPDRQLVSAVLPLPLLRQVLSTLQPRTVFLPGLQEYHPDHRATCLRLPALLQEAGYGEGIWLYEISRHNEANRLVDISPVLVRKRAAIKCFPSQLSMQSYEEAVLGINQSRAYTLPADVTHAEAFLELTDEGRGDPATRLVAACRRCWQGAECFPRALVSLIVRTRNRPGLLGQALASIASQTYDRIEAVVVNDGGCDVAAVVTEALAGRNFRIVDLPENRGRSAAANAGLAAASGKYLGFLDDDDALDPDHVLHLVSIQEATGGEAVVYAGIRGMRRDDPEARIIAEFTDPAVSFGKLLLGNVIPIHAPLFPAWLLEKGVKFDETLDLYEDWDFWLQVAQRAAFKFSNKTTATYYTDGSSGVGLSGGDGTSKQLATGVLLGKWLKRLRVKEFITLGELYHTTKNELQADKAGLRHQVLERDERIRHLEQVIAERDSRLGGLEQMAVEREERIVHLEQVVVERNECIASLHASDSWRMTKPLRWVGHGARRFGSMIQFAKLRDGLRVLARRALGRQDWPEGQPGNSEDFAGESLRPLPVCCRIKPLISVVMPVYNACRSNERYFLRALESILQQSYKQIELIIVDDGSTDNTRQICEEFIAQNNQLRAYYYFKENGGQSSARNFGVRLCSGEYISFLDQDDEWVEDKLERVVQWLGDPTIDVVYTDADVIDGNGRLVREKIHQNHFIGWPHPKKNIEHILFKDIFVMPGVMTIKKELFTRVGGFDEHLSGYEDDDLFLRLYEHGSVFYLPETTLRWRIYGENYSFSERMLASRTFYWKKLLKNYTDNGRNLFRVRMISQRFFWEFVTQAVEQYKNNNEMYRKSLLGAKEILPYLPMIGRIMFLCGFYLLSHKRLLSFLNAIQKI